MKATVKHPSKQVELKVLNASLEEQKKYFEEFWLLPSSQKLLLLPEYKQSLDLYLSMRRPCKEFVTAVLSAEDVDLGLVRRSVVGCSLHPENEVLLVELGNWDLLEEYELAEKYAAPEVVSASTSLGGLFTPEMLAALGK